MSYPLEVLKDNPIAYWRQQDADTTALDISGYNNHGTYMGTPKKQQQPIVSGDSVSVIYSPGSMRSNFGHGIIVPGQERESWALEVWAQKMSSVGGLIMGRITYGLFFGVERISFNMGNFSASHFETDFSMPFHIVAVYDNRHMGLFVNGRLVSENMFDEPLWEMLTDQFVVGGTSLIAEPAVYNHTLTPERIMAHYEAGRRKQVFPHYIQRKVPLEYWRMNDEFMQKATEFEETSDADFAAGQNYNVEIEDGMVYKPLDEQTVMHGLPSYVSGKYGQATMLSSGKYFDVLSPGVYSTAGSIALFFNVNASHATGSHVLLDFGGTRFYADNGFKLLGTRIEVVAQGESTEEIVHEEILEMPALTEGWHHLALTWHEGGTTCYIDNVKIGSLATNPIIEDDTKITFGARQDGSESFAGAIDELHIFPLELTTEEVEMLHNDETIDTFHYHAKFENSIRNDSLSRRYIQPVVLEFPEEVEGSKVAWNATSGVIVETSTDNATWTQQQNNYPLNDIDNLIAGAAPAVFIRQSLPASGITREFLQDFKVVTYRKPYGVDSYMNTGRKLLLGKNAVSTKQGVLVNKGGYAYVEDVPDVRTVELWVKRMSRETGVVEYIAVADGLASIRINADEAMSIPGWQSVYVNGQLKASVTQDDFPLGQWVHLVLTLSAQNTVTLYFMSDVNFQLTMHAMLSDVALYDRVLTASEAYRHWEIGLRGVRRLSVLDDDQVPSAAEADVNAYKQAWQIVGA